MIKSIESKISNKVDINDVSVLTLDDIGILDNNNTSTLQKKLFWLKTLNKTENNDDDKIRIAQIMKNITDELNKPMHNDTKWTISNLKNSTIEELENLESDNESKLTNKRLKLILDLSDVKKN